MADVIEIYRDLGFCENYKVSNLGNIKSFTRSKKGTILKQKKHNMGYLTVTIEGKEYLSHRLVASAFLGLDVNDSNLRILHYNDIKIDNRIENLRIGSQSENMKDSYRNGRKSTIQNFVRRGVKNENAKLKDRDIYEIFRMRNEGRSQKWIGDFFNVRQDNICRILSGKRWKHITLKLI